jgi:cysteate synthase
MIDGGRTIVYQSKRLGEITTLPNLWVAFSGYWPEREARLETATFKELEACAVLSRAPSVCESTLVVASAGNTAAAFARLCSINRIACLIIVPENGLERLQFDETIDRLVRVVSITGPADYYDAIILADRVSQLPGFYPEGGVKNVGRRDGIGTTILSAVEAIGRLPDYYFQAVGSGTGGIAAHEMAKRIVVDRRFGERPPRLMLSQNLPFAPLYISWKSGNAEAKFSARLFEECEGIDIDPASAVSVASLIKAVTFDRIERDAVVLLHITGGGWKRRKSDKAMMKMRPVMDVKREDVLSSKALDSIRNLFR